MKGKKSEPFVVITCPRMGGACSDFFRITVQNPATGQDLCTYAPSLSNPNGREFPIV